jgi:hypothetical protein
LETTIINDKSENIFLKFIKVPYFSDNETKEVKNNLKSGVIYNTFISKDKY